MSGNRSKKTSLTQKLQRCKITDSDEGKNGVDRRRDHWQARSHRSRTTDSTDEGKHEVHRRNDNRRPVATRRDAKIESKFEQKAPPRNSTCGFQKLSRMLLENRPNEICAMLRNSREGFDDLLQGKDMSADTLVLVLKVVAKASASNMVELRAQMLLHACNFFLPTLVTYITHLPLQNNSERGRNQYYWHDVAGFWSALSVLCHAFLAHMPTTAAESLPRVITAARMVAQYLKDPLPDQWLSDMDILDECLTQVNVRQDRQGSRPGRRCAAIETDEEVPSDDFRSITLIPNSAEIKEPIQPPLRKNKVSGCYMSCDHYLDVQFRLLREDFVGPLREGIQQYLGSLSDKSSNHRFDNIRMYKECKFTTWELIQEKHCYIVQLNIPHNNLTKLKNSKRLIYGSLLMFSCNDFTDILFATVASRDREYFDKRQLVVYFTSGDKPSLKKEYLMAESEIYFEPYYQVLKAMQHIDEATFPMKEYIVDVKTDVKAPSYLRQHPLLTVDNMVFNLLMENSWPTAEALMLDETQYAAYKTALTREFCVIQGPPGTGKTFLGLRVARTLLDNRTKWAGTKRPFTPLLVVCQTNHALDQFLEGILPHTDQLVRVGGQSQNEALQPFNIKDQRRGIRFHRSLATAKGHEMNVELQKIRGLQDALSTLGDGETVINFIPAIQNYLNADQTSIKSKALAWLFGDYFVEDTLQNGDAIEDKHWKISEIKAPVNQQPVTITHSSRIVVENLDFQYLNDDLPEESFDLDTLAECLDFCKGAESVRIASEHLFNLAEIEKTLSSISKRIAFMNNVRVKKRRAMWFYEVQFLQETYEYHLERFKYIKFRLTQDPASLPALNGIHNIYETTSDQRWAIYWLQVDQIRQELNAELEKCVTKYQCLAREFEELRQLDDIRLLQTKLVVGMTTTGAAKFRTVLQGIQAPIVIVEEAAAVLESHVVTSLTQHCQQVILIGDHKQLRPSTAAYDLAKNFNFDISLFERLLKNGLHCVTLGVQHRMRPEIAALVVPAIYPSLRNHPTVEAYPPVKGVLKSLYFLAHNQMEMQVDDLVTKRNQHEAEFALRLCRYLLQQGYHAQDITILTTYNGQLTLLRSLREGVPLLKDVLITVVDNYQGEENKIIILSLVRSNRQGIIGFLRTENRVCVALSRAREGLYIMGNMEILTAKSPLWQNINASLERKEAVGRTLTLQCQIHPETLLEVQTATDFRNSPEGGCTAICNIQLKCSHQCKSFCHPTDREHIKYRCKEPCIKLCKRGHPCKSPCYQECAPCRVLVEHTLQCTHTHFLNCWEDADAFVCPTLCQATLLCGHEALRKCGVSIEDTRCLIECETILNCGHQCLLMCHVFKDPDHKEYTCKKRCERIAENCSLKHQCDRLCCEPCTECTKMVAKKRSLCDHMVTVQCNADANNTQCTKKCDKLLSCGHPCQQMCMEECDPKLCRHPVTKTFNGCGHLGKIWCGQEPLRIHCVEKCGRTLACGHACADACGQCVEWCSALCDSLVEPKQQSPCGHQFRVPCQMAPCSPAEMLRHCDAPCDALLACGHFCGGTCGACLQGRLHVRCTKPSQDQLVCGHAFRGPCYENCRACTANCVYACEHRACSHPCGVPCDKCKRPCGWQCEHHRCTRDCGDRCDRPPCDRPCPKVLPQCGHPCIGLCGEKCPPACRVCDREAATELIFGNEDEPDARFILLEDCNHMVEVRALDRYLHNTSNEAHLEIGIKVCPFCRTPICKTPRYKNLIMETFHDIARVYQTVYGNMDEKKQASAAMKELASRLSLSSSQSNKSSDAMNFLNQIPRQIIKKTIFTGFNGPNASDLSEFDMQLRILERMIVSMNENQAPFSSVNTTVLKDLALSPFLTTQRVVDFMGEMELLTGHSDQREMLCLMPVGLHGVRRGAWMRCGAGHYFCVADCGWVRDPTGCPECGGRKPTASEAPRRRPNTANRNRRQQKAPSKQARRIQTHDGVSSEGKLGSWRSHNS